MVEIESNGISIILKWELISIQHLYLCIHTGTILLRDWQDIDLVQSLVRNDIYFYPYLKSIERKIIVCNAKVMYGHHVYSMQSNTNSDISDL